MESSSYQLQEGPTFQSQQLQGNSPKGAATSPPPPPPPPPPRRRRQQQEDVRQGDDQRQPTNSRHHMRRRPDETPPGSASKKSHFFSLHATNNHQQPEQQQTYYDVDESPYYNTNAPSPQHQIHTSMSPTVRALEIMEDELSEKSGVPSWTKRIPWMQNMKHTAMDDAGSSVSHLRSAWSADSFLSLSLSKSQTLTTPTSTSTATKHHTWRSQQHQSTSQQPPSSHPNSANQQQQSPSGSKPMVRSISHLSATGAPFGNDDWTPKDSAYGAACPVCGCLPKNARRLIEVTLITVFIFGFIYFIITTSIRINNEHGDSNSGGSGGGSNSGSSSGGSEQNVQLDDDYYVENTAAAYYADDDVAVADDYFTDDVAADTDDINEKVEEDDAFYAADDANARHQRLLHWHYLPDPFATILDLI